MGAAGVRHARQHYAVYALKLFFYVWMWSVFCSFTPGLGGLARLPQWWLSPIAFEKAILRSMLFEGFGLGCGSGPLTGRYFPPFALYFLRPGTTKLPVFPSLPLLGGSRRTWVDVALCLALTISLLRALVAPAPGFALLSPVALLVPLCGLADRTVFLALRAEHYWTTVMCFAFAGDWIAGAKAVQLALWFPINSPFTRSEWMRKLAYRDFPTDLRPSRLATHMGHGGILLELGVPLILLFSPGGASLYVGLTLMLALHLYITSNVPMGVPIEWNFMVVYGAFALFYAHPGR